MKLRQNNLKFVYRSDASLKMLENIKEYNY